jgi:hypothetical protein
LYRLVYQRNPEQEECALAQSFVANQTTLPQRTAPAWQYGYGALDETAGRLASFTPFKHFGDGQWRVTSEMPDPDFGYLFISASSGHTGRDDSHAAVRRWVAPRDGAITISGILKQGQEEGQGDGVTGYIASSQSGILWKGAVHNAESIAAVDRLEVTAGETIDFVVACGPTDSFDSFRWAPLIKIDGIATVGTLDAVEWNAETDFRGPLPPAMDPWERYAQVLLASNEFAFVD